MKLNDKICKNAKPQDKPYKLADGGGLFLLVHPNGSKYWRYKYRYNFKEKVLAVGVYPEVTLAEARDQLSIAKKILKSAKDPSAEKQREKIQKGMNAENTFMVIADEWYDTMSSNWSQNYKDGVLRGLKRDIYPSLGNSPISEITPPQLLKAIKKVESRGTSEVAHRLTCNCEQVFRYAINSGRATYNPAQDLKGALKPKKPKHHASIDTKELPQFLRILKSNQARLFPQTRLAIELMMLTFVRTSELIKAKWHEIDFDKKLWIIPAHRMKMKKEHLVPLSRQAINILLELRTLAGNSEWVLPSPQGHLKPLSNNTILKALQRMGYKGKMTGHGFRALAMTAILEELKYRFDIPDRQLAHTQKNKVAAAYDRAQYIEERTKMMQDWADYIDTIQKMQH